MPKIREASVQLPPYLYFELVRSGISHGVVFYLNGGIL